MTNKYYGNPLAWGGKQRSPAEAQPVAWQFQDRDGRWHGFMDERHRLNTIADGSWPVRALYTAPPSASVGAEGHYHPCTSILIEGLKRLEGGSDVLEEWDRARVKVDTALAQQPAAHPAITHCDNCGLDWLDNGLNPIGCPYCKQYAWRAAYVAERATRYREGGMKIEQARIHAETDATLIEQVARQQQGAAAIDAAREARND